MKLFWIFSLIANTEAHASNLNDQTCPLDALIGSCSISHESKKSVISVNQDHSSWISSYKMKLYKKILAYID